MKSTAVFLVLVGCGAAESASAARSGRGMVPAKPVHPRKKATRRVGEWLFDQRVCFFSAQSEERQNGSDDNDKTDDVDDGVQGLALRWV
ncbi:hypothetical protein GN316_01915 [Xylophilus sp. Kf1]|nr:hypothetical protein [Xylophilus sp. Kf1]